MQITIIITTVVSILIVGGLTYIFLSKKIAELNETVKNQKNDQGLMMLNQNMQGVQQRIDKTTEAISARLDKAANVISGVSSELGKVKEIGRNMKDLQDFLRSPKLRGNIGEQVLRDILEQCFSRGHFEIQHQFKTGERVDAIIKTDKGIIPIDSKFPMENFQKAMKSEIEEEKNKFFHEFAKDVRKHIDSISKKYILPAEGTVDFAVMYVPSETVYYEVIRHSEDINNYACEKKVFPVSPNSFYYFLRVIMIGLEGKKIEAVAQQILQTLSAIKVDNDKFSKHLGVLTSHITHAKASVDTVNNEYSKLSGKIDDVRLLKE
ncbi:DNA recombination protein RmuC [Patescibacteria group bacterium]